MITGVYKKDIKTYFSTVGCSMYSEYFFENPNVGDVLFSAPLDYVLHVNLHLFCRLYV